MPITAITRYQAACDACGRPLDDEESGSRIDFPDPESAAEYAVDCCDWTIVGDKLVCTRRDEKHEAVRGDS